MANGTKELGTCYQVCRLGEMIGLNSCDEDGEVNWEKLTREEAEQLMRQLAIALYRPGVERPSGGDLVTVVYNRELHRIEADPIMDKWIEEQPGWLESGENL